MVVEKVVFDHQNTGKFVFVSRKCLPWKETHENKDTGMIWRTSLQREANVRTGRISGLVLEENVAGYTS